MHSGNRGEIEAAILAQMMKNLSDILSSRFSIEGMPIDEVVDIITLPKFDNKVAKKHAHHTKVKLPEDVLDQLHNFIAEVALLYNDNPCTWRIFLFANCGCSKQAHFTISYPPSAPSLFFQFTILTMLAMSLCQCPSSWLASWLRNQLIRPKRTTKGTLSP